MTFLAEAANTLGEQGIIVGRMLFCVMALVVPALFIVGLILAIVKKSKGWTIFTVLVGLAGFGVIGAFIYFVAHEVKDSIAKAEQLHPIDGDDGKFSLSIPGNWDEQVLGSADASLEVGNLIREEYLLVIHEPISDFDEGFTIGDFAEIAADGVTAALTNASRGDLEAVEINGMPAVQCRIEGSADGVRIVYLNSYIRGESDFYQVMTWTLPSKEAEAFPKFREAMATFREGPQSVESASGTLRSGGLD